MRISDWSSTCALPISNGVDILRDAHDVVEVLGDGAHLVGTSMGGMVSMNAAGLRPDLVHSLTVIEPPAFALANDIPAVRRVSSAMEAHWASAGPADLPGRKSVGEGNRV